MWFSTVIKQQVFSFHHLFGLHRPRSSAALLTSTYPAVVLKSFSTFSLFLQYSSTTNVFLLLFSQVPLLDACVTRASEQQVTHQTQRLDAVVVWRLKVVLGTQHSDRVFHHFKHLQISIPDTQSNNDWKPDLHIQLLFTLHFYLNFDHHPDFCDKETCY